MYQNYQLVLATDLDGTFLEGDPHTKNYLYNELWRLREQVLLVYVTGRPVNIVKQFCERGYLPPCHFVLGDHGTHIVDGYFQPVHHIQDPIVEKWNEGNEKIRNLLKGDAGIRLQPINPPYRVAYYYDLQTFQNQTLEKIIAAGYDPVQSCDLYLDILPKGVNKGTTLLHLVDDLKISRDRVITSGDSLNDLSLFQTQLKSIAVSNSEPKLLDEIKPLSNVFLSDHPGILGIMDGLKHYNHFSLFEYANN